MRLAHPTVLRPVHRRGALAARAAAVLAARAFAGSLFAAGSVFAQPSMTFAEGAWLPQVVLARGAAAAAIGEGFRSEVLGRHAGIDPRLLGRAWRVGRDPASCAQAIFLSLLHKRALPDLEEGLARELARPGRPRGEWVLPHEMAIAEAMEFAGREADAEAYLRRRLAISVPEGAQRAYYEEDSDRLRKQELARRLARAIARTKPEEADRLLGGVMEQRVARYRELRASQTHGYAAESPVHEYHRKQFELQSARLRYDVLSGHYLQSGRERETLELIHDLIEATRAVEERPGREWKPDRAWIAEQTLVQARIAAAEGRRADAELLYRRCCAPPAPRRSESWPGSGNARSRAGLAELVRLLLADGRQQDARALALRLAIETAREIEEDFDCLTVLPKDPAEARLREQARAERGIADPMTNYVGERGSGGSSGPGAGRAGRLPQIGARLAAANDLGLLLLQVGLPEDARAVLEPALGLLALIFGEDHPYALRATSLLSQAEFARGQHARAAELGIAWRAGSEAFLASRLWHVSEEVRREFFGSDRAEVERWLDIQLGAARPDAPEQLLALSLGRKGMLARVASEVSAAALARQADAAVRHALAALRQKRTAFAALVLRDAAESAEGSRLRREIGAIEAQLANLTRGEAAARGAAPVTPAQVAAKLAPDEALVDFLVFNDPAQPERERLAAIVARGGSKPELVTWPDLAELRARGVRLRAAMNKRERAEWDAAAAALAEVWWQPLARRLSGAKRLYVVPDGLLTVLPWRALPAGEGKLLLDAFEIVQLSSPRALVEPPVEPPIEPRGAATALVLGAPEFGTKAAGAQRLSARAVDGLRFEPLPGALVETQRVATALNPSHRTEVLTGARADKPALQRARSPRVLHLATHGFFLGDPTKSDAADGDPLVTLARTGLALAVPAGTRDASRSLFTALEAASLDLRGTRLVVLSACETALGQTARSDGLYGLVRAFHEAGAASVLGTLWPVEDDSTVEFMEQFYARLREGAAPSVALQATQAAFARHARYSHPRHWAAFTLTGR